MGLWVEHMEGQSQPSADRNRRTVDLILFLPLPSSPPSLLPLLFPFISPPVPLSFPSPFLLPSTFSLHILPPPSPLPFLLAPSLFPSFSLPPSPCFPFLLPLERLSSFGPQGWHHTGNFNLLLEGRADKGRGLALSWVWGRRHCFLCYCALDVPVAPVTVPPPSLLFTCKMGAVILTYLRGWTV